jgi:hypothetical protein
VDLDPQFRSLRGFRASAAHLLEADLPLAAERAPEEVGHLLVQLKAHEFPLANVSNAGLAAELQAQASESTPLILAVQSPPPSKVSLSAYLGTTIPGLEPASNRIEVRIPFENPRATDGDLLANVLDAMVNAWSPLAAGVFGVWDELQSFHGSDGRLLKTEAKTSWAFWLHWRAPGITKETWTDARGNRVSRCWPTGIPDASRPHLGGTLDIYPQHRPDLLARCVVDGRPPG